MEILQDPVFRTNYQKYKVRVKLWESRFTEKHGRKPNKNDIKEADMKIKESYKMYWKLKTRALEETLTDITFFDEEPGSNPEKVIMQTSVEEIKVHKPFLDDNKKNTESIKEQNDKNMNEKDVESIQRKDTNSVDKDSTENTDIHQEKLASIVNNSATDETENKNVKGVWGEHLNKSNEQVPKKKQTLLVNRSSSFQLSQNKFTSSSFTKRNPRKSLSMSKLKSKSEKNIGSNVSKNNEDNPKTDVNNKDSMEISDETKAIFGESVKVVYAESKSTTQSLSIVQQVIEGHVVNRNLNTGWLDRCAKKNNLDYPLTGSQRLSGNNDSGIESMEISIQSPKENIQPLELSKSPQISDEEDFVRNSDSEEELKHKRIRNFKKILSDPEICSVKRLCIDSRAHVSVVHLANKNTQSMETPANVNIANEQKKPYDLNDTNISAIKNNDVGDNKVNITKLSDHKKKDNTAVQAEENASTTIKKQPRSRKTYRRITHDLSDDSDPDFDENIDKRTKKKGSKKTQSHSTRKKKVSTKDSNSGNERKGAAKTRKSTRKKKNTQNNEKLSDDETANPESMNDKGPAIYGIETLETIPRFTVNRNHQGDLIEQFAKSVVSADDDSSTASVLPKKPNGQLTDKEKLEKKVADGKINDNFVRINLKKKVFVRGKKHFNFSKYKKNQWKQKKKELGSSEGSLEVADFAEKIGVSTCFKCGNVGHFSRKCPSTKTDDLIPLQQIDDGSQFPTLEEAQKMASQNAIAAHASRIDRLPEKASYTPQEEIESVENEAEDGGDEDLWEPIEDEEILCGHKIPEDLVMKLLPPEIGTIQPLYKWQEDLSCIETPPEVFETLHKFGHETFRPGQEKAVMRILSGQSTLVTLSTGSGKSLCYQLPAYLYSKYSNCITLVISPLVSLMDDQVTGVPSFLSAACLHTNQTQKVRDNVMQMVKQGKINILLISPEAVVAGEKSTGFGALLRQLPPIAFACIDEAHCISQWSHNFRPSYLMVCRVLREKLRVRTVLALTATATKTTAESIVNHLGIHDGMAGVISDIPMPRNLLLTVSKDENKDQALIRLLRSERFKECNSVIVYCTRREECLRIAGLLRVSLQDERTFDKPNSKISCIAEAYHAGLSAHRRKTVQKAFMSGQIRTVVATVAFGMGLNKPDIRAVIHYNMPGTFEGYVQEVGRAGRDGLIAHCHLFLNPGEDKDKWELRRHIYANGVDRHTIRRLLQKVFVPCSCAKLRERNVNHRCPGHEVAIPVDETVLALDIPEEIISTLLCYLELHPKRFITVLSSVYVRARVSSYNGLQALKHAAQSSPPLAMAIALDLKKGISRDNSSIIEFPVVDVASAIGWDSGVVKSHLKNLEWKTVNGESKRSAISVKYDTLGLRVKAPGDLTEDELDEALDALFSRTQSQEISALQQLETINATLHKFSMQSVTQCLTSTDEMINKSDQLKDDIRSYFNGKVLFDIDPKQQMKVENEGQVVCDIRNLIVSYRDNNFTGRAVARILHGIQSPNYPAYAWGKCRFWRAHLSSNFNALCQIAVREILALR